MTKQHTNTECRKGDHTILPGGVRALGFVIPSSFGFRHSSFHRGSALIAVFWMIAVMGMVVLAGAKALHSDSQATRELRGRTFAKRLAQMVPEVALHPAIRMDDGLLHYTSP